MENLLCLQSARVSCDLPVTIRGAQHSQRLSEEISFSEGSQGVLRRSLREVLRGSTEFSEGVRNSEPMLVKWATAGVSGHSKPHMHKGVSMGLGVLAQSVKGVPKSFNIATRGQ